MLSFTEEQMNSLEEMDFEQRILPELCAESRKYNSALLSDRDDSALEERVRESAAAAKRFGLTSRNDVHAFVGLDVGVAEGFYRDPEVRKALEASRHMRCGRIWDLFQRLPSEVWGRVMTVPMDRNEDMMPWAEEWVPSLGNPGEWR